MFAFGFRLPLDPDKGLLWWLQTAVVFIVAIAFFCFSLTTDIHPDLLFLGWALVIPALAFRLYALIIVLLSGEAKPDRWD